MILAQLPCSIRSDGWSLQTHQFLLHHHHNSYWLGLGWGTRRLGLLETFHQTNLFYLFYRQNKILLWFCFNWKYGLPYLICFTTILIFFRNSQIIFSILKRGLEKSFCRIKSKLCNIKMCAFVSLIWNIVSINSFWGCVQILPGKKFLSKSSWKPKSLFSRRSSFFPGFSHSQLWWEA